MQEFDLIIIGGGPAGYLAAERAGKSGMKAAVIEERKLGGVCLNEGCIPTKTLVYSSKIFDYAVSAAKYGVEADHVSIVHKDVLERKDRVVQMLVAGVEAKMKKYGVTVIAGRAKIAGKENGTFHVLANGSAYNAEKVLIATGSVPVIPPVDGMLDAVETGFAITNREILDMEIPPRRLAILGGGVIGLEMAAYFNALGCEVTVIEMLGRIGGNIEPEIGRVLQKGYTEKGVEFLLSSKVMAVKDNMVFYEQKGVSRQRSFDKLLVSVGRKPNIADLGLETAGVAIKNGGIVTDGHMGANVPGLYAAGDVTGISMLAHTAYREAEAAVNHMAGKRDRMRYKAVPSVIYTNPEAASVGETEASALEKGLKIKTVSMPMKYSGRYLAETDKGDGMCKIVADIENNRLLGVHMVGSYVSEIIYGAAVMIEAELRIEDIKELIFPHPTVSEIIREAIFEL